MPSPTARPTLRYAARSASILLALCAIPALLGAGAPAAVAASPAPYAPDEVVVGYAPAHATAAAHAAGFSGSDEQTSPGTSTRVVRLAPGVSVADALRRLRAQRGVAWAVPDYRASIAGGLIPNDEAPATALGAGRNCSGTSLENSASMPPKPGPTSPPTAHPAAKA